MGHGVAWEPGRVPDESSRCSPYCKLPQVKGLRSVTAVEGASEIGSLGKRQTDVTSTWWEEASVRDCLLTQDIGS